MNFFTKGLFFRTITKSVFKYERSNLKLKLFLLRRFHNVPRIVMNNGLTIPAIGLGTWNAKKKEVAKAVEIALNLGYRHIDCAMYYGNEKEIGEVINNQIKYGSLKRSDLFITSKLWNTFHERQKVKATCEKSLEDLSLDYLDLYLIHWPMAQKPEGPCGPKTSPLEAQDLAYDYLDTWVGMQECVDCNLAKSIGVSNFNSKQLQRVLDNCRIKPVVNQFEVNLLNNQKKMIAFCEKRNVKIVAYSPLGSPNRPWVKPDDPKLNLNDPKLLDLEKKYDKTVGQIILRYIYEIGCIPIPKSVNCDRLAKNLNIFNFELEPQDIRVLDSFNIDFRAIDVEAFKKLTYYPFHEWI